jgi:hypothetical protein
MDGLFSVVASGSKRQKTAKMAENGRKGKRVADNELTREIAYAGFNGVLCLQFHEF